MNELKSRLETILTAYYDGETITTDDAIQQIVEAFKAPTDTMKDAGMEAAPMVPVAEIRKGGRMSISDEEAGVIFVAMIGAAFA